ncbi:hypothetical protein P4O66_001478 [Electrophorus voltai]|uniref:Alkylated DNA repair protein AlkB homologue 8 N-terminal domain-containing protein n=1 Tax=Electrophorus voltai TaxID=2609070 RepID=A0AAD9DUZ8_9TELE|nr:hypothetical protein P4O66_001478 [Electrophorus voltai]
MISHYQKIFFHYFARRSMVCIVSGCYGSNEVSKLKDLSWSRYTNSLAKKARQRLYHLRRLRDFKLPSKVLRNFYTCTIESILTGNITVWFGNLQQAGQTNTPKGDFQKQ